MYEYVVIDLRIENLWKWKIKYLGGLFTPKYRTHGGIVNSANQYAAYVPARMLSRRMAGKGSVPAVSSRSTLKYSLRTRYTLRWKSSIVGVYESSHAFSSSCPPPPPLQPSLPPSCVLQLDVVLRLGPIGEWPMYE